MVIDWVVIPSSLGVLLSALIELLKLAGVVKDGDGGRWALGGSIIIAAALTLFVQALGLDLEGNLPKMLIEIAGLIGSLILALLGSFGTHKLFKAAKIFPQHRG